MFATSLRPSRALALSLRLGTCAMALMAAPVLVSPAYAQETTSSMTGSVSDPLGQPAAGTKVEIVHVPSGTRSTAEVNAEGRYSAAGLRVGGPYTVRFTAPDVPQQVVEGLFLRLGEPFSLDVVLQDPEQEIQEIVVTGERQIIATGGSAKSFSSRDILNAPTVNRDLKSTLRIDPRVSIDPTNSDAISIAGSNNRFNQISVDGVRQSDDFGLNNNGYPTQRSPISLDAIEQLAVVTNPFNVEYGGFQGGLINIVTKSGSNEFHGSAFYSETGDKWTGDKNKSNNLTFDYKEENYGGTLGGPIVEDRVFFFVSYEKLDSAASQDFGPSDGNAPVKVPGVTSAQYNQIIDIANRVYNYNAVPLSSGLPEDDEKYLARIDVNITDDHRAVLTYQRSEGNQVSNTDNSASNRQLATGDHLYNRAIKLDQYTFQLFSDWTNEFSTEVKFGRKEVDTIQAALGNLDFAHMEVRVPQVANPSLFTTVFLGPDQFRHANSLTNDLNTYKVKGEYLAGEHTFTFGYEREELDIFNLFVSASQGVFVFNSIADFEARRAASLFYQNAPSNNAADGAAAFAYETNTLYVEDKYDVSDDLELTFGLRYDWFASEDKPVANTVFTNRYGFSNTETLDGLDLWSPRFGFKYDLGEDTVLRGGVGLFGGGTPNVWISNSFSNTGVATTSQTITRNPTTGAITLSPSTPASSTLGSAALNNVNGFTLPAELLTRQNGLAGQGDVNAIDPEFEIASEWQFALGVEHEFDIAGVGEDFRLSVDAQYARTRDAVLWKNIRYVQNGTLPDGRPAYVRRSDAPSGNDLLLTNTSKGQRLTITTSLEKDWELGLGDLSTFVGYTYQDSKDANPATSSTALSNWDNIAVRDMNDPDLATSNYEIKHRVSWVASWENEWIDDFVTTVSFVGEHRSGRPYSFTFRDGGNFFDDPRQNTRDRQLFYVPRADCSDINLAGGLTCATLNDYITRNELEGYRGGIVPRNSHNSPWIHTVDMSLKQQIPAFFEGHTAAVTLDIKNLTNLLNSDWGRVEQVGFPHVVPVVTPAIGSNGRWTYSGTLTDPNNTINARSSVWQIMLGVRYDF